MMFLLCSEIFYEHQTHSHRTACTTNRKSVWIVFIATVAITFKAVALFCMNLCVKLDLELSIMCLPLEQGSDDDNISLLFRELLL